MEQIRKQLEALAEEDYRKFNEKIVPDTKNMLGVRLPKMREIARARAKENPAAFLEAIEAALRQDRNSVYYEEIMVYGLVIGYAKFSNEERMAWLDRFRKHIDNWAVCDSCCMTYKWMKKNPETWWEYLMSCVEEETEYSVRFAVVCMLDHFVVDAYVDRVLEQCNRICAAGAPVEKRQISAVKKSSSEAGHMPYYVQMAVAWAVSVCYVKYSEKAHAFLESNRMDVFTHNKSIQKICESYRVTKEQKNAVRALKR